MRLKQYIIEEQMQTDANILINTLIKDCNPFIKELKKSKKLLWRGSSKKVIDIKKFTPRKDRHPLDTPIHIHNELNNLFYKKFGWKPRSEGVFTIDDKSIANYYGDNTYPACMFFPIGKYEYIWNPNVHDLYSVIKREEWKDGNYKKLIDGYINKNYKKSNSHEITFKCNSYYLINEYFRYFMEDAFIK